MALRNIDFEALKSLRDRNGAAFPRGRVIFREGDTSAEFYVILQGAVELSIKDKATGDKTVLHTAQAGAFFGEMSCFGGMPRSATATAAEDSFLLFFNQDTAIQLLRASPRFGLGVIQTLCDRIRTANEKISALSDRSGGQPATVAQSAASVPTQAAARLAQVAATTAATAGGAPPREVPPPRFDKAILWGKLVQCPVSNTRFTALNVRPEQVKVRVRESDFREVYAGPNPLWYLVYVCPECLYAAYPDDFPTVNPDEGRSILAGAAERHALAADAKLGGDRDLAAATASLRIARDCYRERASNPQRLGGLLHRIAWLAREAGDAAAEKSALAEAVESYAAALEQGSAGGGADLVLLYTIGEIHLRLGDPANAIKHFALARQHRDFAKQPDIQRLVRDRWIEARALARPAG